MIGHAGGLPVEEALLPLLSSLGAVLFLARTWVAGRLVEWMELLNRE